MNKYVLEFEKKDLMIYISHLDLLRLFKRAFKRTGIKLNYSKGFNPHPIMGFAQPLSLGYIGLHEFIEFETEKVYDESIIELLNKELPKGMKILNIDTFKGNKSLAADTNACEYEIEIPLKDSDYDVNGYFNQNSILAMKRMKKTKKMSEVEIKDKIRSYNYEFKKDKLLLNLTLDGGSISNLSPELVIQSITKYLGIEIIRSEIIVKRKRILFN
ncbi:MAG TPA: TIGR03936 family radical SAM-associated protein [Anaerovoracaceae bacterium]|nr:TIGR03936 family radical SAM-associated protein [Anaerovoracaceae bacterium]